MEILDIENLKEITVKLIAVVPVLKKLHWSRFQIRIQLKLLYFLMHYSAAVSV